MSEPVLTVRGIARSFGDHRVLADLDLEVRAGAAAVLVGPNGAGKSTALRCITGADQPDAGTVEVLGEPLDERSATVRAAMAVVMDDLDFFPDLTVVEHLDLFARAHRTPDADDVVDDVLEEVGLIAQSGQLPASLSSGQRRRLALASAFVRPRRLLVLDEPEQRLDQEGLAWLVDRLLAEKAAGLAIVLASHSQVLVDAIADDVVTLARPT
ncbi:ABC transporter ATP-binding protein [Nocardioides albidus]|uniref:ABC transporter ATP-binding protein n=1 Tax=Nocardioides albidus TaxID=1517589 RepID=A0A5C4VL54_9ACTN|nr:ABC transporter ATP-binding protein [Nocardioides albidus]TNM36532.1 ABC transporter ATP-binding protein [Nocardioides albidus]